MAAPGAGRRRENQLRELILKPPRCYPPRSPDPNLARPGAGAQAATHRRSGKALSVKLSDRVAEPS
eukprot:4461318-Pyramimonas_sp.AAC.1